MNFPFQVGHVLPLACLGRMGHSGSDNAAWNGLWTWSPVKKNKISLVQLMSCQKVRCGTATVYVLVTFEVHLNHHSSVVTGLHTTQYHPIQYIYLTCSIKLMWYPANYHIYCMSGLTPAKHRVQDLYWRLRAAEQLGSVNIIKAPQKRWMTAVIEQIFAANMAIGSFRCLVSPCLPKGHSRKTTVYEKVRSWR